MALSETVERMKIDRVKARELHQLYKQHRSAQTPEDKMIETAYREIARGRVVIRALASVRTAGRLDTGLPKLAIIRADILRCHCRAGSESVTFSAARGTRWGSNKSCISVQHMPRVQQLCDGVAIVPLIPIHLRPKAALDNYHILWEADWRAIPHDPLLLRKLTGDMWIVLAAWDLTDVERAAMEQRVNS